MAYYDIMLTINRYGLDTIRRGSN